MSAENENENVMGCDHPLILPASLLSLESSPSFRDGVDQQTETMHRAFAAELIAEAGVLLELPLLAIATAQHTMHRLFFRKSLLRFDAFPIAAACVLLASKIEESPLIVRAVIMVFHRMYQRRKHFKISILELGGEQYNIWKQEILLMERHVLKELGFAFYEHIEHPHYKLLMQTNLYLQYVDPEDLASLRQRAWNYLNDSMRLDLCLRHRPEAIACAALYMAMRDEDFVLARVEAPWWEALDCSAEQIAHIANRILDIYDLPKLTWLEPLSSPSFLSRSECLRFDAPSSGPKDDFIGIPGVDGDLGAPLATIGSDNAGSKPLDDGALSRKNLGGSCTSPDLKNNSTPIGDEGTPPASDQSTPEAVSGAKSPLPESLVAAPPASKGSAPPLPRESRPDSLSLSRSRSRSRSRTRRRAKSSSSSSSESRSRSRSRSRHRRDRRRERSRGRDGSRRDDDRSSIRRGADDRKYRRYDRRSLSSRSNSPRRSRSFDRSRRRR